MSKVATIAEHIEITPDVRFGKPRIAGTRITVSDVVILHEAQGMSPAEIIENLAGITLGDVHEALAFYHDNPETIETELEAADALERRLEAIASPLTERLRGRITAIADGEGGLIPRGPEDVRSSRPERSTPLPMACDLTELRCRPRPSAVFMALPISPIWSTVG